ncbi:arginine deiminase family protein [Arcticibacter eurypsychrophilus]|uniref:arginine deiminase family protein n=1 Tax=Arcticibacter eurypsychrophilus TaxID=1434752 RepID=UPI00084D767A|nr:arginine deiminase family protein [Arcticibacter eurypsychrophilus]
MTPAKLDISVNSEIGTLRAVMIHSPDSGIGRVAPSKAQDWLFEDIIHLDTVRADEYDHYVKLLLYFLDPSKIKGKLNNPVDTLADKREFYKPGKPGYFNSDKVVEVEKLLADILEVTEIRNKLCAAICAIEECSYALQLELAATPAGLLSRILISGSMPDGEMLFPPIPNLIFTRDIGITINNFILLSKPAKKARGREALLSRYIFYNHPLFSASTHKILEFPHEVKYFLRPGDGQEEKATLEGGDVMVISPDHILIGCSERTSPSGANEAIRLLFEHDVVKKITVIRIPHKRDYMHIDTLFTQVNRHTWVVLGSVCATPDKIKRQPQDYLSEKKVKDHVQIFQFSKGKDRPKKFKSIENLLSSISEKDLGSTQNTNFIYSGNNEFPYDEREQWTDSCNLLALREGIVLGYDRNDRTIQSFKTNGFSVIHVKDLITQLENEEIKVEDLRDTLILMPSGELSRARGGFHCMSLPLIRDSI